MGGLKRAFMGSARRLEILTGSGGFLPFGDRDAMARMRKQRSFLCSLAKAQLDPSQPFSGSWPFLESGHGEPVTFAGRRP
jgi:hypothetical protein